MHVLRNIIDFLGIITSVLLLIFSFFLLTIEKWKKLSVKILCSFLIVNSIYIIAFITIISAKPVTILVTSIFYFLHPFGFLFGPILLYYSKITIYGEREFRKSDLVHLIPFITLLFYSLIRLSFLSADNRIWLSAPEGFMLELLLNIQVLLYMIFALIEVRKYRKKIRDFYSSITGLYYSWLAVVLYGFFFMWFIDFTHFLLDRIIGLPATVNSSSTVISLTINFSFAILIFYKGLTHPEFFSSNIKEEKHKYEKSKLTKEDAETYLKKLQDYMVLEKPFLIPNININELSAKVDIPMRILSQIINDSLDKNFFDFINSYRIEESKKYLTDPKFKQLNILEILYEAGFNSKATFNKVFKEYTGLTPSEYRQRNYPSADKIMV